MNVMEHDRPPGRTRRRSTKEFKADAVALVLDGGLMVAQAARDLGIGETNRGNWVRQARIDRGEKPGWATEERAEMGWQRRCSDPKPSSASCGIEVYVSGWPGMVFTSGVVATLPNCRKQGFEAVASWLAVSTAWQ